MSNFFAPIHPDGWKFVALFALATILLFILVPPLGWVGLVLTVWCAYFFRDPWRVTPLRAGLMVSPADGRVLSIAPAVPPAGPISSSAGGTAGAMESTRPSAG